MENKKIKVLQINASSQYGGVSAMILNYCRHFDLKKFTFDFLSPEKSSFYNYEKEIKEDLGGNIYQLDISFKGAFKYLKLYKSLNLFFKNHNYDIVHINSGLVVYNYVVSLVCKKAKIQKRIVHSHSSIAYHGLKKVIVDFFKKQIPKVSTDYFACSEVAAISMFTKEILDRKNYVIVKNAIDVEKHKYNIDTRIEIRSALGIEGKIVIGHVGRFVLVKNHEFILKVFKEIHVINPNSVLLLIGDGPLKDNIIQLAKELEIADFILFLGEVSNVCDYYQAMDVFLLPSLYEGLPVSSIEAQTSGLPCFISSNVSKECKVTDNLEFMSINNRPEVWANHILNKLSHFERIDQSLTVKNNGYDIINEVKLIENKYMSR